MMCMKWSVSPPRGKPGFCVGKRISILYSSIFESLDEVPLRHIFPFYKKGGPAPPDFYFTNCCTKYCAVSGSPVAFSIIVFQGYSAPGLKMFFFRNSPTAVCPT